jgi:hypothetical protein
VVLRDASDGFKGAAKSPHIKAHLLFGLAQKSHLPRSGVSNRPNTQPINLPNSDRDNLLRSGI